MNMEAMKRERGGRGGPGVDGERGGLALFGTEYIPLSPNPVYFLLFIF